MADVKQRERQDLRASFAGRMLTEPEDTAPFLTDWRGVWTGTTIAVAMPDTPSDVAAVIRWCAQHRVAVVPQGGNTGLSGGATPDLSGRSVVVSTVRLNRVRAVDSVNNTITLDAGCILKSAQEAAEGAGRLLPLSLAAEGSCTIGGNLATNAGGTAVLRYGNARELCLGLEVATASGDLWDGLRGLRKDNSGYDLRDIFIGSEGTLGIITGAVLKLVPRPAARATAFVAVSSIERALDLLCLARDSADAELTAFEFLSEMCLALVLRHSSSLRRPLEIAYPWYILIELSAPGDEEPTAAKLERILSGAFEAGLIEDAALAGSLAQRNDFWALRENIAEAQSAVGKSIKHDVAVPLSRLPAFLTKASDVITARWPDLRFVTFGHLGDGNIHYNFSPALGADQTTFLTRQGDVNRVVHDVVVAEGGTISAEHGLGVLRRDEIARYKTTVELELMHAVKRALDPAGIMNPGKFLPQIGFPANQ